MKKHVLDLAKFRSVPRTKGTIGMDAEHCVQGAIAVACGAEDREAPYWVYSNLWKSNLADPSYQRWLTIAYLNDKGHYDQANNLALQTLIESGEFEFVNAIQDETKLIQSEAVNNLV